jgi:hypothetical protein
MGGLVCADPGARTPIGASGNLYDSQWDGPNPENLLKMCAPEPNQTWVRSRELRPQDHSLHAVTRYSAKISIYQLVSSVSPASQHPTSAERSGQHLHHTVPLLPQAKPLHLHYQEPVQG